MRICVVSSCGGHLTEVRSLKPCYRVHDHFYVLNDRALLPPDMEGRTIFIRHSERDWLLFVNLFEAYRILRRERPQLILSTGAGPAVPFAIVGKLLGIPTIFIESFTRVTRPSLTGRIAYRLAARFFYQWRQLAPFFPEAKYCGPLFMRDGDTAETETGINPQSGSSPKGKGKFVFVTVGNATQGFRRLLEAVDRLAGDGLFGERIVIAQTGNTDAFEPAYCEHERFFRMDDFVDLVRRADLVISHGGVGTLFHVVRGGKLPVVMPRRKQYGEIVDDHQVELIRAMHAEGWLVPAFEPEDLPAAIAEASRKHGTPPPDSSRALATVEEAIRDLTLH